MSKKKKRKLYKSLGALITSAGAGAGITAAVTLNINTGSQSNNNVINNYNDNDEIVKEINKIKQELNTSTSNNKINEEKIRTFTLMIKDIWQRLMNHVPYPDNLDILEAWKDINTKLLDLRMNG